MAMRSIVLAINIMPAVDASTSARYSAANRLRFRKSTDARTIIPATPAKRKLKKSEKSSTTIMLSNASPRSSVATRRADQPIDAATPARASSTPRAPLFAAPRRGGGAGRARIDDHNHPPRHKQRQLRAKAHNVLH